MYKCKNFLQEQESVILNLKKLSDKAHYVYLAETVVVKETQSSAKVSGVVPVMSSHCAGDVPPTRTRR